jgi:hypothetical protein
MILQVLAAMGLALVFVGSAQAECAWVLWERTTHGIGGEAWTEWEASGFPTSAGCEAARQRLIASAPRLGGEVHGDLLEFRGEGFSRITRVLCQPDTIDPRGPKLTFTSASPTPSDPRGLLKASGR